jgi:putative endonuclease
MAPVEKRFVYVLRSERKDLLYVGVSCNVAQRFATHNSGGSLFTAPHRPWRLAASIELPSERRALELERYLKSGSGRAFIRRHFL